MNTTHPEHKVGKGIHVKLFHANTGKYLESKYFQYKMTTKPATPKGLDLPTKVSAQETKMTS